MKRKPHHLETNGHKVFVSYDNTRAFGRSMTRKTFRGDVTVFVKSACTQEFQDWMSQHCGPPGTLWTSVHTSEGHNIYFAVAKQAMLAKLTWA